MFWPVRSTVIRQEKEIKGIQVRKEEVKLPLCADDMIVYTENSKEPKNPLLRLINELGKAAGDKGGHKSPAFLFSCNE